MKLPVQPNQYSRHLEQQRSGEIEREAGRVSTEISNIKIAAQAHVDAADPHSQYATDTDLANHVAATTDVHAAADYAQTDANETITGAWKFDDTVTLSKTSGKGIKVDTETPTFGWRDIIGTPQEPATGSGKPTWTQIATSGIYTWNFASGDVQWYAWHIPHDYVPGSDIHFHAHWFGPQTAGGYTKWQFDYIYAKGHNQAAFPTTATVVSVEQQQSTTAYQHMIAETNGVSITGLEVDGLILCKVSRVTPTGTEVSGGVFVPVVDLHYQSTNIATKQKAPPFWT